MEPLVSIIIATYNREKYLKRAIQSIFEQSYKNFEIIIVDDSTNDKVAKIVQEIKNEHDNIIYIKNDQRLGFTKSLNKGIEIARGKYIARLDDDDFWADKKKLEKQIRFLENYPEYVLVGGGVIVINEMGQEIRRYLNPEKDEEIRKVMLFECPFSHSNVVFRKETWEKVGGYNDELNEDWDLWCRFGRVGKFYNFPEYFNFFTEGEQNRTQYILSQVLLTKLKIRKKYRKDYPHFFKSFLYGISVYFYSFLPQKFRQFLKPIVAKIKRNILKFV